MPRGDDVWWLCMYGEWAVPYTTGLTHCGVDDGWFCGPTTRDNVPEYLIAEYEEAVDAEG